MKTSTVTPLASGLNRILRTWLEMAEPLSCRRMNVPTYGTASWLKYSLHLADPVVYTMYVMYKVFSFVPGCSWGLWTV